MPLIPETPRPLLQGVDPAPEAAKPRFIQDVIPAALRTENLIGSALAREKNSPGALRIFTPASEFNPFDHIEGFEDSAKDFIYADNEEEVEAIKSNILRERKDRQTIADGGAGGFVAAVAAGVVDPTIFIPVGGQLKKGESILRLASRTALAGAAATTVQEAGLQATQTERTGLESALNIAGGTVLSGLFGAGWGALTRGEQAKLAQAFERDMLHPGDGIDPSDAMQIAPGRVQSSVGAARAPVADAAETLEENAIAHIEGWAKKMSVVDPTLQLMTSPSAGVRVLGQQLADIPLILAKNGARFEDVKLPDGTVEKRLVYGKPTAQSVESAIGRKSERYLGETQTGIDDIYVKYLTGEDRKFGGRFAAGVRAVTNQLPAGKMKPHEFNREIWKSLSRGDKHEVPEVAAAAAHIRQKLFKPLEDEAVDLGLFGVERVPGVDGEPDSFINARPTVGATAESYRPRLYNTEAIRQRRDEFVDKIFQQYRKQRDDAQRTADALGEEINVGTNQEIEFFRSEVRGLIKERKDLFREAKKEVAAADKKAAKTGAVAREKATQAKAAADKVEALTATPELPPEKVAYYRGLSRDVARGHGDERPDTLLEFVRRNGGISDLDAAFGTDVYRRKNVSRAKGKPMDYMREAAEEAGFLDEGADLNDFIDLLDQEFRGEPVYHPDDFDAVSYDEFVQNLGEEASKANVDVKDINALASWYEDATFKSRTPFKKGRVKEAYQREQYALRRLEGAPEAASDALDALAEARVYSRSLREAAPEITEEINRFKKALRGKLRDRKRLTRQFMKFDGKAQIGDEDLLQDARRTVQRIESTPVGRLSYDYKESGSTIAMGRKRNATNLSGRFKARKLLIPDEEIEDFLEDDLEVVLRSTARSMIPDIELTKRFGSIDMTTQFKAIADDFEEKLAAIDSKSPDAGKQRKALTAKRDQAMKNVAAIRDRLRGTYGLPENPDALGYRAIQTAKSINHIRLMGGVTLSSIPDTARTMMANGFGNFAGVALETFTKGLSSIKGAADEVKLSGAGWELVNDTRTMAMADLLDDFGRHSKFERGLNAARNNFGQLSLMAPWNHVQKTTAGLTIQNRILRGSKALKAGKITPKEAEYMASLGISKDDALAIADQFGKHGQDGRVANANTSAWEDPRLADVFHDAMRKEINRIIVTPGQEKPLFTSGPVGSMIFQFQSYNFAATQRVALAMAQGMATRDAHAFMMFFTQISLGMVVAAVKMHEYGRQEELADWEARRWLAEGIDRSGVLGALTYINLMAERLPVANRFALSSLAGDERLSRYQTRGALGTFFGPTVGFAEDAFVAANALDQRGRPGGITSGERAAMRRLLPYQNLFYLRWLFDEMEKKGAPQ